MHSKTIERSGIGVYRPRPRYSENLDKYPIIFLAEVHAIEKCIQFCRHDALFPNRQCLILSMVSFMSNAVLIR